MLRLADTSVRLYRKRDWSVSVRLHSYLMLHSKGTGFRLSAYLNRFDCSLTLESGEVVEMDNYSYTDACLHRMDHMIHEFWASGRTEMESIQNGAARLQITYRLFSFDGQGDPDVLEMVVPVLARGSYKDHWARKERGAA